MQLINQHTKKIMEECKIRARDAGLRFDDETLEYIVTNNDMIELSPKGMIPTMYDYWVDDVEVLKGKGQYKLYPHNPYETVINSRPAISFYNDNNPDWMNIMIFYHVIAHIDFFQNNLLFKNTWNDDFVGQSLADKRLISSLRSEHGRWVDYIIEFCRSIDNLVGYFSILQSGEFPAALNPSDKLKYYFVVFLQTVVNVPMTTIFNETARFNDLHSQNDILAESIFFSDIKAKYPEFESKFEKFQNSIYEHNYDILEFIRDNSPYLKKEENSWMKSVMNIIRGTSLYFAPQIRTKTINEGWASYWHDELFRKDDRIGGHQVAYAITNANVTSISRIGLNPYAIGLRLIQYVEELADKGKLNFQFQILQNQQERDNYNKETGKGKEAIFELRKTFSDFMLVNTFVNQEFVDMHDLFVTGKRLNQQKGTVEYYIKSRKAEDYKKMLIDSQYHPPSIEVNLDKTTDTSLYLVHSFEGKQLYKPYINDTLMGIAYLWGGKSPNVSVQLETTDVIEKKAKDENSSPELEYRRVIYTMKDLKLSKRNF